MTASDNNNAVNPTAKGQKLRFCVVISVMVLLCAGSIWFIFRPAEQSADEGATGINPVLPAATVKEPETDKRKAYEDEQLRRKEELRERILRNLADSATAPASSQRSPADAGDVVAQSRQTYRQVSRQVATFYQTPREDPEVAELRRQVDDLTAKLKEQQHEPLQKPDPTAMMEKSYELAARYFTQGSPTDRTVTGTISHARTTTNVRKGTVSSVVSSLTSGTANTGSGFHTAHSAPAVAEGIPAVIAEEQTVRDGDRIKLRLSESMTVGGMVVPAHTLVYGIVRIERQRVGISVVSVEVAGTVATVDLTAYDTDGQPGLYVPNSAERTAAKNAAAAMGTSAGSSLSVTRGAGTQIAADLSRSALSAASQYLSTKLTEARITLKAGYRLYLISNR